MLELITLAGPFRLLFGTFLLGALGTSFAHVFLLQRAADVLSRPRATTAK